MKLEKTIIIYATDEAKKKWEGKEKPVKTRKSSCPACDLEELKKNISKNDYTKEEKE